MTIDSIHFLMWKSVHETIFIIKVTLKFILQNVTSIFFFKFFL